MSIVYEQPVPRRGGPNDPAILDCIAAAVIRRAGDSFTADRLHKAITGTLDAYLITRRDALPNPTLDTQEVWHADVDEHEERVDDRDSAETHIRIAHAHLALAGAITDDDTLNAWRNIYGLRALWANRLAPGHEYDELKHETREAVDALINAGIEP